MRPRYSLLVGLSAIAALFVAGAALGIIVLRPQPSFAAASAAPARELTVIGHGKAQAAPDTTIVQLGVETRAEQAQAALRDNNAKMEALLARLKELKISDSVIETSNFSIWSSQEGPMPDMITYRVSNVVRVTLDNVDGAGAVLENVVEAGANSIAGVTFTLADPTALEQQARDQAIAHARTRAEAMAKASGATLGQLLRVSETIDTAPPMSPGYTGGMAAAVAGAPVQAAQQTITAYVQVTFELK